MSVYAVNMSNMSLDIYAFWFLLILCRELYRNSGLVGNADIMIYFAKNYT
jgi:hypothetical protein